MLKNKTSVILPYFYDLIILLLAITFFDTEKYFFLLTFVLITLYLLLTHKPYYFEKINLNLIKIAGLLISLSNPFVDFTIFWLVLNYIIYLILINEKIINRIKLNTQKNSEIFQKYISGLISFVIITTLTAGFSMIPLVFQFLEKSTK